MGVEVNGQGAGRILMIVAGATTIQAAGENVSRP